MNSCGAMTQLKMINAMLMYPLAAVATAAAITTAEKNLDNVDCRGPQGWQNRACHVFLTVALVSKHHLLAAHSLCFGSKAMRQCVAGLPITKALRNKAFCIKKMQPSQPSTTNAATLTEILDHLISGWFQMMWLQAGSR